LAQKTVYNLLKELGKIPKPILLKRGKKNWHATKWQ